MNEPENKTGLVLGRLTLVDLMDLIEDSSKPLMRRQFAEWLGCLSEFIHQNKERLETYDYALVISLPLAEGKKTEGGV